MNKICDQIKNVWTHIFIGQNAHIFFPQKSLYTQLLPVLKDPQKSLYTQLLPVLKEIKWLIVLKIM